MKRGNAHRVEGGGSGARRLIRCNMFTLHHLRAKIAAQLGEGRL